MGAFENKAPLELLSLHVAVMDELTSRGIMRSANNPAGDYAEYLFCEGFGWDREVNSRKGYDATRGKVRYQIKGRRMSRFNSQSRQLSAIRDLDGFDFLAGVLFDHEYQVRRGALIPAQAVRRLAVPSDYTNSYKLFLRDSLWDEAGVEDVTATLRAVATK